MRWRNKRGKTYQNNKCKKEKKESKKKTNNF